MFGGDLHTVVAVSAMVTLAMCYVRFAAWRLRPGLPRLCAFTPVLSVLPLLPLTFRAIHARAISGLFLAWLAEFKLLLLATGQGPLHPSLPFPAFVFVASGPVRLRDVNQTDKTQKSSGISLMAYAVMAALFATIVSLYQFKEQMHQHFLLTCYVLQVYLSMELILGASATAARALLGMELEPTFDRPYLATSLRDFWGRRWNVSVPAVLRPCVYSPMRALIGGGRGGAAMAVLATFLVSGLMHEWMFYYITLQPPTGEATTYFVLQGACTVVESWWASHKGWWRPPRMAATPLTLAFATITGIWLLLPPLVRSGAASEGIAECEAIVAFVWDLFSLRRLLALVIVTFLVACTNYFRKGRSAQHIFQ
ncbi:probable long-chain-alcohol O-fatty-acyltransferase 5 [Aegilops tauschii subsp. strangulata]|uniref:Wax synthase domain-containing protein n=1 Tax=Aegilops tauschii subsp. strangulata TaxID=200361 RepID=A0A453GRV0_AEGTS|nr:probable long-chain-alcohol O-fatty-acyltransferase 5 [Aegilops tauschii subsp. strangulata]